MIREVFEKRGSGEDEDEGLVCLRLLRLKMVYSLGEQGQ